MRAERREIAIMERKGFSFTVRGRERRRFPLFFLWHDKEYHFDVKEPVGGCLIAQAAQWVEIDIDSRILESKDSIMECNAIIAKHAWRCYRILALAVLNERCQNDMEVLRLQHLFERTLTPAQLRSLLHRIMVLGDLQSFTTAIRLMSKVRMTEPNLVADTIQGLSASGGDSGNYAGIMDMT